MGSMREIKMLLVIIMLIFLSCENTTKKEKKLEEAKKEMALTKVFKMEKDMRSTIDDLQEVWNKNDKTLMRKITIEDLNRFTNGKKEITSREEYLSMMDVFHEGFSNINVEVIGDPVFVDHKSYTRFTFSGDNTGSFNGNPPTGKSVRIHGFSIWSYNEEGMGTKEEVYYDHSNLLGQLGYVMNPPEVAD